MKNTLAGHGHPLPPSADAHAQLVRSTSLIQKTSAMPKAEYYMFFNFYFCSFFFYCKIFKSESSFGMIPFNISYLI